MKKFFAVILLFVLFTLTAAELFSNTDLKQSTSVYKNQKVFCQRMNFFYQGGLSPKHWAISAAAGNGGAVTYQPGEIRFSTGSRMMILQQHNIRVPRRAMGNGKLRLTVTASGKGTIGFCLYAYGAKNKYLKTVSGKNNTCTIDSEEKKQYCIDLDTSLLPAQTSEAALKLNVTGNIVLSGVSMRKTEEKPVQLVRFKNLSAEEKLAAIMQTDDLDLLHIALFDSNNDVRNRASCKLSSWGTKAFPVIGKISDMIVNDPFEPVRVHASLALCNMGRDAYPVIKKLLFTAPRRAALTVATTLRGLKNGVPQELREAVDWANPPVALSNGSMLPDGGFEGGEGRELIGWKVEFKDGATGSYCIDNTVSRDGTQSLKITKTNGKGYIRLISTQPVTVPAVAKPSTSKYWVYRFFFKASDASYNTLLTPRLISRNGTMYNDDSSINRGHGIASQTRLRNTPDHAWSRRAIFFKQRSDERELHPAIIMYGNPATVWIDDVSFPAENYRVHEAAPTAPQCQYTAKEVEKIIGARKAVSARVQKEDNGRLSLVLNGEKVAPVLYMNRRPSSADYNEMHRAGGIKLQVANIYFGGNTRYRPFRKPWNGSLDSVDEFIKDLDSAVAAAPHSTFILGIGISFPPDFTEKYPDEAWINEKGERAYGSDIHMRGFGNKMPSNYSWWWPSQYSEKGREMSGKLLRAVLEKIRKRPYSKLIAGVFVHGGHDGQFQIHRPDYSKPALAAWRKFLAERYGSDEALSEAWKKDVTIAEAPMPPFAPEGTKGRTILDPEIHRMYIDNREFREAQIWKNSEYYAKIFKEVFGSDKLALTWCMGGGWQKNFNTLCSSCYDGFVPQPNYSSRLGGYTGGINMAANTYLRHGKFVIAELDTRNWMRCIYNEVADMWVGVPRSRHDFRNQVMKDAGRQIALGHGYWYFDIGSNEYRHPEAMKVIRKLREVSDQVAAKSAENKFTPDVALVFHQQSVFHDVKFLYHSGSFASVAVDQMLFGLKQSGVPAASYFFEDMIKHDDWKKHKIFVFLNANVMSDAERKFINENLKKNGNTLVWIYTSGISNGKKFSPEFSEELTGMKLSYSAVPRNYQVNRSDSADPLNRNLPSNMGCADVYRRYFDLSDANAKSSYLMPCFNITDKDAAVLGRFNDGTAALAVKRFDNWQSVFCAAPGGLDAELFNNIASDRGAYTVSAPGLYSEVNDFFMSIHCCKSGKYNINLPRKVKQVRNAWNNQILGQNCSMITLDLQAWQSLWLILE